MHVRAYSCVHGFHEYWVRLITEDFLESIEHSPWQGDIYTVHKWTGIDRWIKVKGQWAVGWVG